MILLLSGQPDVARIALGEKVATDAEGQWRHMPLDQLDEVIDMGELGVMLDEAMLVGVAINAAKEMQEEGFHIVLTHPEADAMLDELKEDLGEIATVHLGEPAEGRKYHHTIEMKDKSVNEAYAEVADIIGQHS